MGKNLKHYSDYLNERRHDDEELAPFTTSDGWDERQLGDIGLIDLFAEISKVMYEVKNARRGSYARFGDTPQELGQHLIELGERLNSMGDAIMEESS
jgi:hypothetical protein